MRPVIRLMAILAIVFVVPAQLNAVGPHEPWKDGCVECFSSGPESAACAQQPAPWGTPSWVCTGGSHCLVDGSGERKCFPECGSRCYSA